MAADRHARCPHCGSITNVTADELEARRGFCAICKGRFDVLAAAAAVADGPMRASALVPLAEPLPPLESPPDERIEVHRLGHELRIRSLRGANTLAAGTGTLVGALAFGMVVHGPAVTVLRVVQLAALVVVAAVLTWRAAGTEVVELADGELRWKRGLGPLARRRRLPAARVRDVDVLERVSGDRRIVVRIDAGGAPLDLGDTGDTRRRTLDRRTAEWLRRWVRHALAMDSRYRG